MYGDYVDCFEMSAPDVSSLNDVVVAHLQYDTPSDPLIMSLSHFNGDSFDMSVVTDDE